MQSSCLIAGAVASNPNPLMYGSRVPPVAQHSSVGG